MWQFTEDQLLGWFTSWFWPFCRIGALFTVAPIFQDRGIPRQVKIALAIAIAALISLQIPPANIELFTFDGLLMLLKQLLIGGSIGLVMRIPFAATEMCGNLIGLQMGIGFATFFNPQERTQTPILGTFLTYIGLLLFLAIDGHLIMIASVTESFRVFPLNTNYHLTIDWYSLVEQGALIFSIGFHLAMPILATLLLTNVMLGVLTRAAPQLNVFSIGFPVTLFLGFFALLLALPFMQSLLENYLYEIVGRLGH